MKLSKLLHLPRLVYALAAVLISAIACGIISLAQPRPPQTPADSAVQEESSGTTIYVSPSLDEEEPAENAQEEAEEVEEVEETVEPREVKYELEGDAAPAVEATNAYGMLTQAVGSFEDKGYTVSFVVHDVNTGHEITYDSDEELYPASSIKAPFTCSVYQMLVETGKVKLESVEPTAAITILESSDEGYRTLHEKFGEQHFIEWLKDAGVEPGSYGSYDSMVSWNYPHISSRQLELMWMHIYEYLTTETAPAIQLAEFLEEREVSSLRKALGEDLRTWSKMGWFDSFNNYRSEPATVEAGTVFSEDGPYVFAVITTAPAELDELIPVHQAIYRAHKDMVY